MWVNKSGTVRLAYKDSQEQRPCALCAELDLEASRKRTKYQSEEGGFGGTSSGLQGRTIFVPLTLTPRGVAILSVMQHGTKVEWVDCLV